MWALTGLKRLIASGYVFSETERTRAELEKYRIESNSVLSFAKLYCVAEEEGVTVRDDLFLRYKEYCGNAGMKPVSQTNFNKELEAGFPEITRGRDKALQAPDMAWDHLLRRRCGGRLTVFVPGKPKNRDFLIPCA